MSEIKTITGAPGFEYSDEPQRSPYWQKLHVGRVGASRLGDWLSVSKSNGKPLKARVDLEREIAFGKAFGVPFNKYVTGAMQEGIDNEDFVREQYVLKTGNAVTKAGAFYNDYFIASPDGLVGDDGGIEIKWLQDSNWTTVVETAEPLDDHYAQIQGNLYASGRTWWEYVAANGNTGSFVVITVGRDEEMIAHIAESVKAVADVAPLSRKNVFSFEGAVPVDTENKSVWEDE